MESGETSEDACLGIMRGGNDGRVMRCDSSAYCCNHALFVHTSRTYSMLSLTSCQNATMLDSCRIHLLVTQSMRQNKQTGVEQGRSKVRCAPGQGRNLRPPSSKTALGITPMRKNESVITAVLNSFLSQSLIW